MKIGKRVLGTLLAATLLAASAPTATGNPWTKDQGRFYLSLNYNFIVADRFHGPDFKSVTLGSRYTQHTLGFYGEVGIITRWLTASLDINLFRHSALADQGLVYGFGDMRVGLWTGLVTKPVKFALGILVGFPTGDPVPRADVDADLDAQQTAASLPTGDGEFDVEFAATLGKGFGGKKKYPLKHYVVAGIGYWIRTKPRDAAGAPPHKFRDVFNWKAEIGTNFPWRFIERFWFTVRIYGSESLVKNARDSSFSGFGDGISVTAWSFEILANLYKGLAISASIAGAFRYRNLPSGPSARFSLSYQR